MTREEQIEKAWLAFSVQSIYRYDEKSVKDAIKWADEHPNLYNDEKYHTVKVSCLDELYRKSELYDTFMEKACEWLQLNAVKYMRSIGGCMYFDVINSVNDFKKAMEE